MQISAPCRFSRQAMCNIYFYGKICSSGTGMGRVFAKKCVKPRGLCLRAFWHLAPNKLHLGDLLYAANQILLVIASFSAGEFCQRPALSKNPGEVEGTSHGSWVRFRVLVKVSFERGMDGYNISQIDQTYWKKRMGREERMVSYSGLTSLHSAHILPQTIWMLSG